MSREAVHKVFLAKPEKGRYWILGIGLFFSLVLSVLSIYQPLFFRSIDLKLYDSQLRSLPKEDPSGIPVIVDIDEKSLFQLGQWPWPRYRIALLLEKIKQAGALSVSLDMVFPEEDRTSLRVLQKEIERDLKIRGDFWGFPKQVLNNDAQLAWILSRGPFVLGFKFLFPGEKSPHRECLLHPLPTVIVEKLGSIPEKPYLVKAQEVVCNLQILSEASPASGFFNVRPDSDGIIRKIPLVIEYAGRIYPSLSLAAFIQATGKNQVILKVNANGLESLRLGDTLIPVDAQGNLLIRYRGPAKTFSYLSAVDILNGKMAEDQLKGKIVFLGTTAAGLGELRPTPLDPVFPGVEIQATVLDNLLRKDFLSRPNWIPGLEFLLVLISGFGSTLLLFWTGAVWSLLILGGFALSVWQASGWFLQSEGIFLSPFFPMLTSGSIFSFLTALKYWQEEKRLKERTEELALAQDFTILCLAALAETRDSETGGHIFRSRRFVQVLAKQLATRPKFAKVLTPETIDLLYKSAPLHDIGKVGVHDAILLKPGRLTEEEYMEMKKHTVYGRQALQSAEDRFGKGINSSFLEYGKEMAYTHHEKWDGSGYPDGLQGEKIPLFGRIMAIADVYDALISKRVYKRPVSHEEAVSIIIEQKGALFDPQVVEVFLEIHEEFRKIAMEFADHEEEEKALPDAETP
ncbi:MAG: metal-dependent phosphohydrolase [Desulfobacca sp.]|nr:metal-dependent phosphohydrolase [Desulfobacca sp.]